MDREPKAEKLPYPGEPPHRCYFCCSIRVPRGGEKDPHGPLHISRHKVQGQALSPEEAALRKGAQGCIM